MFDQNQLPDYIRLVDDLRKENQRLNGLVANGLELLLEMSKGAKEIQQENFDLIAEVNLATHDCVAARNGQIKALKELKSAREALVWATEDVDERSMDELVAHSRSMPDYYRETLESARESVKRTKQ